MNRARVVLGKPELQRMAKGQPLVIKMRPGTAELELSLSLLAQGELTRRPKSEFAQDFEDMIGALRK